MAVSFDSYAPFDDGAGANAGAAQWRKFMGRNMDSGVLATAEEPAEANELEVDDGSFGMLVKVMPGECWIRGHWGKLDSAVELSIPSSSWSNDRIDRVVARARFDTERIEVDVVQGTPAVSPTAPPLTRTATTWEIPLAQVLVEADSTTIARADITDERVRVGVGRWSTGYTPALYTEGTPFGSLGANPVELGSDSATYCRYILQNKVMHIRWEFNWGSTESEWAAGAGRVFTFLPPGFYAAPTGDHRLQSHLWTHTRDPKNSTNAFSDMDWLGYSLISPLGNRVYPFFPKSKTNNVITWMRIVHEVSGTLPVPDVNTGVAGDAYPEGGSLVISGTLEVQ